MSVTVQWCPDIMTDQEVIDIVTAHRDGKTIQHKNRRHGNQWEDYLPNTTPSWSFHDYLYRVKPDEKPPVRDWWIILNEEDGRNVIRGTPFKPEFEQNAVHVREVLE